MNPQPSWTLNGGMAAAPGAHAFAHETAEANRVLLGAQDTVQDYRPKKGCYDDSFVPTMKFVDLDENRGVHSDSHHWVLRCHLDIPAGKAAAVQQQLAAQATSQLLG
jgi:hypothetical protein